MSALGQSMICYGLDCQQGRNRVVLLTLSKETIRTPGPDEKPAVPIRKNTHWQQKTEAIITPDDRSPVRLKCWAGGSENMHWRTGCVKFP